jgi:hypothetical protein
MAVSDVPETSDTPESRLVELFTACWRTKAIYEAVRLGLIDGLAGGARTAKDLAAARSLDADATHRLLRALATLGVCRQTDVDTFELAALGAPLRVDAQPSLRGMALHWGDRLWDSLASIGGTLETGKPGMSTSPDDFAAFQADPHEAEIFNRAMAEKSERIGAAVAQSHDFGRFATIMDVGGGYGAVLSQILKFYPELRGWSFDMPPVETKALEYLAAQGVADRAGFLGGSFFDSVPGGMDCLILKYILHDWNDAHCRTLLRACRRALEPGGTVLVVEQIVPEIVGPEAQDIVRGDLIMLSVGGKERTEREYRAMLDGADLPIRSIVAVGDGFSIMECTAR